MEAPLPDKLYFKIGEVSQLTALKPSVLRFWETEFAVLSPVKSRTGQRLYSRSDIELVMAIKQLLYSEKLTIEGARHRLQRRNGTLSPSNGVKETEQQKVIAEVKAELLSLRNML